LEGDEGALKESGVIGEFRKVKGGRAYTVLVQKVEGEEIHTGVKVCFFLISQGRCSDE
jgi:hypothetical protein